MAVRHSKRVNPTLHLTKELVESFKPKKARYVVHDAQLSHLRLLIHPSGRKTYQIYKSFGGRPITVRLGEHPTLPPTGARKLAQTVLAELAEGYNRNTARTQAEKEVRKEFLSNWQPPPPIPVNGNPGVLYFLFREGHCVYVGQTKGSLQLRLKKHRNNGRDFDSYSYIETDAEALDRLEAAYIFALRPEENRVVNLHCVPKKVMP